MVCAIDFALFVEAPDRSVLIRDFVPCEFADELFDVAIPAETLANWN